MRPALRLLTGLLGGLAWLLALVFVLVTLGESGDTRDGGLLVFALLFVLGFGLLALSRRLGGDPTERAWPNDPDARVLRPDGLLSKLLPGSTTLRLDATGLTWTRLGLSRRLRWADAEAFGPVTVSTRYSSRDLVGYDRRAPAPDVPRAWWRRLNRALAGREQALPSNFGLDRDELLTLLQTEHARHT